MLRTARPRILMTADTVGGVWTYALDLVQALERRGIDTVLATMGAPPSAIQRRQAARLHGLVLHPSSFKLEWMDQPWPDVERAGDWLLHLEKRYAPDLVHLNNYCHGALAWRSPTLMVAHSCVLSWWEAVHGEAAPQSYRVYRSEVRRGLQAADRVVAPSQTMLDALHRHYGPLPPSQVIHNGRDARHYSGGRKQPLVLTVGRLWDAAKNIEQLMQSAPALHWPVYLAGEAQHPNGNALNLDKVCSLGQLAPGPLASWYGRASIYVSPARYEPFGLSVLEAGLSGCALVLGDIPSLRELWDGAAVFVPPDDRDALTTAVNALVADGRRRAGLMRRARTRARAFTLVRMVDAYAALYAEMLGRSPAPARRAATAGGSA